MSRSKKKTNIQIEEPLQAVVLADSFESRFLPITLREPKALLPLAGVPLLDYTLEFLFVSGIKQVFVLCTAHASRVKEYLSNSRWSNMDVEAVWLPESRSTCDSLRAVLASGVIQSDPFVLVNSDIVASMSLADAIAAHRSRSAADPRNVITMVFKQSPPGHPSRSFVDDENVIATAPWTASSGKASSKIPQAQGCEVLAYADAKRLKTVTIPPTLFRGGGSGPNLFPHSSVTFRYDLMDTYIDICSPSILELIEDEFDWRSMRQSVIRGILASDVLGYRVFAHIVNEEYAARINCLKTYDAVSRQVVRRWAFPITPDNNIVPDTQFTRSDRNVYRDRAFINRTARVEANTIIGKGTFIGAGAVIRDSIIGKNCHIESGARIIGSYLWDRVLVGEGSSIEKSLLCSNVIVGKGANVRTGSVVSYDTIVGESFVVPPFSRVCGDSGKELGANSKGSYFLENDISDLLSLIGLDINDEDDLRFIEGINTENIRRLISLAPGNATMAQFEVSDDDDDDFLNLEDVGDTTDVPYDSNCCEHNFSGFLSEIASTMRRHRSTGVLESEVLADKPTIELEVSTLKRVYKATLEEYSAAIFIFVFNSVFKLTDSGVGGLKSNLKSYQFWWHFLLKRFVDSSTTSDEAQYVLFGLEKACSFEANKYLSLFVQALQWLYLDDILSYECIVIWSSSRARDDEFLSLASPFIQAMMAQHEEEEEEEEEDEYETE